MEKYYSAKINNIETVIDSDTELNPNNYTDLKEIGVLTATHKASKSGLLLIEKGKTKFLKYFNETNEFKEESLT